VISCWRRSSEAFVATDGAALQQRGQGLNMETENAVNLFQSIAKSLALRIDTHCASGPGGESR
jgi:hypothetical protein